MAINGGQPATQIAEYAGGIKCSDVFTKHCHKYPMDIGINSSFMDIGIDNSFIVLR